MRDRAGVELPTAAGRTAFITGIALDNVVKAHTGKVVVWSATQ
ncbi:hypothetical protein [Nocardia beijingensis]|nr:hypothetical protein [Nocardia beijingensis]